jgi:VWFA-related protein
VSIWSRATAAAVGASLTAVTLASQTFRVGIEGVRVDALVTDGNKPVVGLTAADFELRDAGVLQRIDSVGMEDVPLSVTLALDTSSSMHGAPLEHLKDAAAALVDLLAPRDRAALLTFAERVTLRAAWTSDHAILKRALTAGEARGATSLYDAAYAALTIRDRVPGRALVLIFSDGDDTWSWLPGQSVLDIARRSDAVVYAVGLRSSGTVRPGYRVDFRSGLQPAKPDAAGFAALDAFLPALAADSGGNYLDAERSEKLRDTFVRIVTEFRSRYLLSYVPRGVDAAGWHPLDVKLTNRKGKVTARRGYLR